MAFVSPTLVPRLRRRQDQGLSQAAKSQPARKARTTSAKLSLPWQPEFEAAVLKRSSDQDLPLVNTTPAPTAPPKGLTARRVKRLFLLTWRLAAPFWRADKTAVWHAVACALLTVFDSTMGAVFTEVNGNLFTALNESNAVAFSRGTFQVFGLLLVVVPASAITSFVRSTLVLRWQQFLTKRGIGLYFERGNYYELANLRAARQNGTVSEDGDPDNPDEVIHGQFAGFARNMVDIAMTNLKTIVELVIYSLMLLRIFPPLYAFILAIVCIGMFLINIIGKRLVDLEALLLRRTADFRFSLARIRIHAESIAFYNGDKFERGNAEQKLDAQAETILGILKAKFPINMFINSFYYLPSIIPLLFLGPLFFAGRLQLGQLTKTSVAFNVLFDGFSMFVGEYAGYASLGASVERLSRFVSSLEEDKESGEREFNLLHVGSGVDSTPETAGKEKELSNISFSEVVGFAGIDVRHISVDAPDGSRRILQDIDFTARPGSRLLIVGPSGRGKTSLLRAIAGLWTTGQGVIKRPPRTEMFFMPQRPYCVQGTLREQILYPNRVFASDERLEKALQNVGLPNLTERAGGLNAVQDWAEYLSAGENQRLAFARLLIAKPSVVLIDEGTSALDLPTEDMLMRMISRSGCTLISVGHRPSLVKFHTHVLHLKERRREISEYELLPVSEFEYPGVSE